ncbi:ArsC/Spx/MgsR family protein [Mobilicoccus pelagius]|uniref:Arsenate reductase n=1 Tax=Mobilicoccus pelagius NBRC 104925 TaxID=1089455 RepID=H5UMK1_9MICO|nr:ArsC/Spx/MgsR family protein [Mobilicoccus pelagius]GAB46959.1 arsenate reductase [Mobilicoccus pelagius NBRC 104925]
MLTILHNPRCSTSRKALEAIEAAGVEVGVVRYLDTPLGEQAVLDLLDILEDAPGDLVRHDATFTDLGLTDADVDTPEKIADVLAEHPRLMQRPVVIAEDVAIIGRPVDRVAPFVEEHARPAE